MSYYTKYKFHLNIITIYKIKNVNLCINDRLQLLTPRDINLQNWKYTANVSFICYGQNIWNGLGQIDADVWGTIGIGSVFSIHLSVSNLLYKLKWSKNILFYQYSVISSESVKVLYFHCLDNQTQIIGFRLSQAFTMDEIYIFKRLYLLVFRIFVLLKVSSFDYSLCSKYPENFAFRNLILTLHSKG